MSHVATVKIEVRDLAALRATCAKLGLEFVEGQQTWKWYGRSVGDYPLPAGYTVEDLGKCAHAIRIPGNSRAYEIGVVASRTKPGTYELMWDFWQGGYGIEAIVGKDAQTLKQRYAAEVARKHALRSGMRVTETVKSDGTIVLRARQ